MTHYDQHHALQSLTLGKPTPYRERYDPSLLQAVPRALNRDPLGLQATALPFHGTDIWTLYELYWLNEAGLPQVAIGEIALNATRANLIESKSFKLYLNSYNQTRFPSREAVRARLAEDLSRCAGGEVQVVLRALSELTGRPVLDFDGECIDDQPIRIDDYTFTNRWLDGRSRRDGGERNAGESFAEVQLSHHTSTGLGLGANTLSGRAYQPRGAAALFGLFPPA